MSRLQVLASLVAATLMSPASAAEVISATAAPEPGQGRGVEVRTSPGFTLYNHQLVWRERSTAPSAEPAAALPSGAQPMPEPELASGIAHRGFCGPLALDYRPASFVGNVAQVRRRSLWRHTRDAACLNGLPVGLYDALLLAESRYDPNAVSHAGAGGVAQLMPATARELGVLDRFDPVANIHGGARYLRDQINRFGSIALGVAAYNAGPGAVERAGGIPRNRETPGYVTRVLSYWQQLLDGGAPDTGLRLDRNAELISAP